MIIRRVALEPPTNAVQDMADHSVEKRVVAERAAVALVDKRKRLGNMHQVLHVSEKHGAERS